MTVLVRSVLGVAACLLLAACTSALPGQATVPTGLSPTGPPPTATSSTGSPAPSWPPAEDLTEAVEARPAGMTPPPFPNEVEGYSLSHEWRETVRAFDDGTWSTIFEFPATMNGCDLQRFYVRWRSTNPDVRVEAALLSTPDEIVLVAPAHGVVGWMSSSGCGQPAFRVYDSANESTLTDIVVEIQQWEIAV